MKERGNRRRLWELTGIYLSGALLMVAVLQLGHLSVSERAVSSSPDPFPALYAPKQVAFEPEAERTVYLTYDDGPSRNTQVLLDILKEEGVPATFFVSGQTAEEEYYGPLLRRMVAEGHSIGLHTYSHVYEQIYTSAAAYLTDVDQLRELILQESGYQPEILRFPGGSATRNAPPAVMQEIMREIGERGYPYYDWNVVSGDDTSQVIPAGELAANILGQADGLDVVVVLCHDGPGPQSTPEATRMVIAAFREQGYQFAAITQRTPPIQIKKQEK